MFSWLFGVHWCGWPFFFKELYLYHTHPVEREISWHWFLQNKNTSKVVGYGCLRVQTSADLSRAKVDWVDRRSIRCELLLVDRDLSIKGMHPSYSFPLYPESKLKLIFCVALIYLRFLILFSLILLIFLLDLWRFLIYISLFLKETNNFLGPFFQNERRAWKTGVRDKLFLGFYPFSFF